MSEKLGILHNTLSGTSVIPRQWSPEGSFTLDSINRATPVARDPLRCTFTYSDPAEPLNHLPLGQIAVRHTMDCSLCVPYHFPA